MANSVLRSIEVRPDSAAPRSSPSVSDGNRRLRCSDPRVLAVVLSVPLSLLDVAAALGVAGEELASFNPRPRVGSDRGLLAAHAGKRIGDRQ